MYDRGAATATRKNRPQQHTDHPHYTQITTEEHVRGGIPVRNTATDWWQTVPEGARGLDSRECEKRRTSHCRRMRPLMRRWAENG